MGIFLTLNFIQGHCVTNLSLLKYIYLFDGSKEQETYHILMARLKALIADLHLAVDQMESSSSNEAACCLFGAGGYLVALMFS